MTGSPISSLLRSKNSDKSLSMAVLDSVCTKSVFSLSWLNCYLEPLSPSDLSLDQEFDSNASFKFRSGKLIKSIKRVTIHACMNGKNIHLTTDFIESDIPLVLSKEALKKSNSCIDIVNDKSTFVMLKYLEVIVYH